jgi:hypothetical protein
MRGIAGLVRCRVFRTTDVLEFGNLSKEAFQMMCKRGAWRRDPARGSGYPRKFPLAEVGALVIGHQIGRLVMGRPAAAAPDLSRNVYVSPRVAELTTALRVQPLKETGAHTLERCGC